MIELLTSGIVLGLLSNFHCLGMCGPFALSLPVHNKTTAIKIFSISAYQVGRIVTYICLGLLFGYFGKSITTAGIQQSISIIAGLSIILISIFPLLGNKLGKVFSFNKFMQPITKIIAHFYKVKSIYGFFIIGLMNGLFPCGMVYLAIATAFSTGSVALSGLFMFAFGIGTLPAMVSVSFAGQYMSLKMRRKFQKITPYLYFIVGAMLVVRGLGINIPYLSPALDVPAIEAKDAICH